MVAIDNKALLPLLEIDDQVYRHEMRYMWL